VKPFRIEIKTECAFDLSVLKQYAELNARQPCIQKCAPHGRRLAIVGGGPLVVHDLDELRTWQGDIWAINNTAQWLTERGIDCTLFSVDAAPMRINARDAILARYCHPELFEQFDSRALAVDFIETHPEGLSGGRSSSTRAPGVAFHMGYLDVSFFGCEGSFLEMDHVDRNEGIPEQLIVRAGGMDYRTDPGFIIQCEELAQILRLDGVFHNRSGGLLKAMIENPDTWAIVGVSPAMKKHLEEVNGYQGLFDLPYQPLQAA
jgi:hypothetical protein